MAGLTGPTIYNVLPSQMFVLRFSELLPTAVQTYTLAPQWVKCSLTLGFNKTNMREQ